MSSATSSLGQKNFKKSVLPATTPTPTFNLVLEQIQSFKNTILIHIEKEEFHKGCISNQHKYRLALFTLTAWEILSPSSFRGGL